MSRHNRLTEAVFAEMVGTDDRISSYDKFLATDKFLDIEEDKGLRYAKGKYDSILTKLKTDFETLANLEEVIMQYRSKEMVEKDIKLSIVREYIYARALFYRRGKDVKDIRVVAGKTEIYGDNVQELYDNTEFMKIAKAKLLENMDRDIEQNMDSLRKVM
jgi:hypothetical protein